MLIVQVTSACAKNPTRDAVISKNDGSFDISVLQTVPQETGDTTDAPNTTDGQDGHDVSTSYESLKFESSFFSTDGSVEFSLNIDQSIIPLSN